MDPRSHVDQHHFKRLGWLTVSDRVRHFRLIHVYRIFKGMAPDYLATNFTNVGNVHQYSTRGSKSNFFIPATNLTAIGCKSFDTIGRKEWNALPQHLKETGDIKRFKSCLKDFFMEQY